MTTFDPTDKKYQKHDEFPPDKASTWPFPAEKDGWVLAHNSLRAEMRHLVEAVEGIKNRGKMEQWEIDSLKTAWASHHEHIEAHHSNEDALYVPFMETRCHYPNKYSADHKVLEKKLGDLDTAIKKLTVGQDATELHTGLIEYETMMLPHLEQEEIECLPLSRAYFTPAESGPKVQEIIGKGPKVEMGSFIVCMGQDKFRNEFMPQQSIPWFVWYLDFAGRVKEFDKRFSKPIEALKTGSPMKKSIFGF